MSDDNPNTGSQHQEHSSHAKDYEMRRLSETFGVISLSC